MKAPERIEDTGRLLLPRVDPAEVAEALGAEPVGSVETWSRQFVNRWVLLPHQRASALQELRELIRLAQEASPVGGGAPREETHT